MTKHSTISGNCCSMQTFLTLISTYLTISVSLVTVYPVVVMDLYTLPYFYPGWILLSTLMKPLQGRNGGLKENSINVPKFLEDHRKLICFGIEHI